MAFQAEVTVALRQQCRMGGTMRNVTDGASLTQGLVLKKPGPDLFSMTGAARFVQTSPHQTTSRFGDVDAMGIMALAAGHAAFQHRMPGWKPKLIMHFPMAVETDLRLSGWIENEPAPATACGHVQTARSMTRFATGRIVGLRGAQW